MKMLPALPAASLLNAGPTRCSFLQEKQKRRRGAGPSCPGEMCTRKSRASLAPWAVLEEVGVR